MKNSRTKIPFNTVLILVFSITLLMYVTVRAYILSFTHDESLSFTIIQGNGMWVNTANNHALNTLLMSLSSTLFGNSEFSLRLPNVLAFMLYLLGCYYIFRSSKNNWLFFFGFSLALLNHFTIEFFSLARGYGLSLALILMSIYFLLRNSSQPTGYPLFLKDFVFSVLFASLAVYANLGMINFLIAVILLFIFKFIFFQFKQEGKKKYLLIFLAVLIISFVPLALGIKQLLKLNELDQLYFGASNLIEGFDRLIFLSLSLVEYHNEFSTAIKILLISSLSVGLFSVLLKREYNGALFLMIMLIFTLIIGLALEHFLFSAKYPTGRTALLYVPIIAVFLYHLLFHLLKHYKIKKSIYIPIILLFTIPLIPNFLARANFIKTSVWYYDAHTKDVMELISAKIQNRSHVSSISNHWLFEPTINYYITARELNLGSANRGGVNLNSDFIYKLDDQNEEINYKIIKVHDDINSSLLMKTEAAK